MLSELLPSPDMHSDWQSFARALVAALDNIAAGAQSSGNVQNIVTTTPVSPGQLPPLPAGFAPVWLNNTDALLYLGNPDYDPPTAPNVVFIDTAKLADAAVALNKLQDGAVSSAKILNATIASADIGNAQIISALVADAAIVNAKILDLAVNDAKIANAAITSAKIANLAVGTAHIQAAAINSAHIGNAQILTAHIADGNIVNAKIGNTIQSSSWNPTTKAGWLIDKTGLIQGSGIAIYDTSGNLVFGSGGTVAWSAITGYSPGPLANRVRYSQMELGTYSWDVGNPNGLSFTLSSGLSSNRRYIRVSATFTANGQSIQLKQSSLVPNIFFPVQAGERLSVSLKLEITGPAAMSWSVHCVFVDAAGGSLATQVVASGTGPVGIGTPVSGFITVPANAMLGQLEISMANNTAGAGARQITVMQPMISGAAANQTTHPNFTTGPNGFVEMFTAGNISTFISSAAIGTALIQDASISTAKIQDLAVTSAKIVSLDAAKINAATLSAITADVGLLRTATSGARIEIDGSQIRVYYASGNLAVVMGVSI